jgi:A/G-specific adenine glycosylase
MWFAHAHRELPFRNGNNPYATWVSEIMLQQTQVKTVIPYFSRWMHRFPNITTLAAASESEVLSSWQGLGYYSRARNLHLAAKQLVAEYQAELPRDPKALLRLPGIGRYTAGAIASIAYNLPEPIVDGNVIRVLTRLDARHGNPRVRPLSEALWSRAETLVKISEPSRFNQGLMELGALVCTPQNPACAVCPLLSECRGRSQNLIDQLPELPKRSRVVVRHVVVLFARRANTVLLRQQPPSAIHWSRMFVLPYVESTATEPLERVAEVVTYAKHLHGRARLVTTKPLVTIRYPITRFRFEAEVYAVANIPTNAKTVQYYPLSEIDSLAVPAPHRKLITRLLSE